MKRLLAMIAVAVAFGAAASAQQNALPNKYAGSNTVTIFDSTGVYMEESGLSHVLTHKRIEMFSFAGCGKNSTYKMDYDPLSAYCEIRRVLVHRVSTGRCDTLVWPGREGNRPVYDYVAPARMIYWGASQKMVEVGHMDPGDQLEVWTYKKGFTYALLADEGNDPDARYIPPMKGHYYDIVPFYSEQPVKSKVYQLNILNNKKLQYKIYNGNVDVKQEAADEEGRTLYTFSKSNIAPSKREPNGWAFSDTECKLLLSTSPDWQTKSRWFYGVNEDYGSFKPTEAVQNKVNELLAGAKDEMDSISRLTHWVADNIRYAGISMGEGEGYTLHSADMNFTDRCGVCKDKASMLIAMLRAAGFKAYAAMTMAGERIDRIPADQFNHSVCAVQLRNGTFTMLDPTWVPNVRELWSSAEQQQGYLIGTAEGCDLMETPVSDPVNHYIRIVGESAIDKEGTLTGTITITAEGQSDAAVRRAFGTNIANWRESLERQLTAIAPAAEISAVEHTNPDEYLKQPVSITYRYRIPEFATVDKDAIVFVPLTARNFFASAMPHLYIMHGPAERTKGFSDRCSRFVDIRETITLPDTYAKFHYPMVDGIADPAASFGCGFQMDGNTLTFGESLSLAKRRYEATEWPQYRAVAESQRKVAETPVILTK